MQTFFTHPDPADCGDALDPKRLKNNRNEALVCFRTLTGWYKRRGSKGWPHHSNVLRWKGYEAALCTYGVAMAAAVRRRGITSAHGDPTPFLRLAEEMRLDLSNPVWPAWTQDPKTHAEHRALLKARNPGYYGKMF